MIVTDLSYKRGFFITYERKEVLIDLLTYLLKIEGYWNVTAVAF